MFVRTASERDLETIKTLLSETWHTTYDAIYGVERVNEITAEWHSLASLKARLTRPISELLAADDGKTIAGMAFAAATSDGKVLVLHQLYVRPGNQRAGIAGCGSTRSSRVFPKRARCGSKWERRMPAPLPFMGRMVSCMWGRPPIAAPTSPGIPALIFEKKLG